MERRELLLKYGLRGLTFMDANEIQYKIVFCYTEADAFTKEGPLVVKMFHGQEQVGQIRLNEIRHVVGERYRYCLESSDNIAVDAYNRFGLPEASFNKNSTISSSTSHMTQAKEQNFSIHLELDVLSNYIF